jgi:Flp pilus assembly protein TadG
LLRDNRGSTLVEYALVSLPVLFFILGIMQTGWIVWIDNMLTISVDAAARCGAVQSTTPPCASDMITTANQVFAMSGASFSANTCTNGVGLIGTYSISFLFITDMTLTAKSCYPVYPVVIS